MDKQYEQFCMLNALFYDSTQRSDRQTYFPVARRPLPQGWRRTPAGDWIMFYQPSATLPQQGWKIHVSVCQDNAAQTLTKVWEYCLARDVPFKIIGSPRDVLMRNMKYAQRQGSGKAATIYPSDEAACERVLRELDAELDGAPGPYILSDLRYGGGPLYVRYGAFTERSCQDSNGETVPAIETPSGELVPDVRSPVFTVPDWVKLPGFLAPHLAARNSMAMADLKYEVTGALHFSNGGGVYMATDKRDGSTVVLKEARPHAGLAADGSDAVTRLRREHSLMLRLSGLGIAPEVRGYFHVGDHHFLVEEFIDGNTLNSFYGARHPLSGAEPNPEEVAAYTSWAVRISAEVERAAALMHERGVVFNDLHPFNIMVRPDETVAFIDFEAASDSQEERLFTVANPGYAAPPDRTGFAVDAYSLACLRLALFMPMTTLFPLGGRKAAQLAAAIADIFPVPADFLDEAVAEITGTPRPARRGLAAPAPAAGRDRADDMASFTGSGDAVWPRLSADLARAIRASATLERTDRLFPGDVDQFRVPGGGITVAYGAAGVLFALSEATGARVPQYENWLLKRVKTPPADIPLGLYDGLSGVAWTLARLGHRDAAIRLAERCLDGDWERLGHNFYSGLAGFGLAMLDMGDATAEPALAEAGLRAAGIVADAVTVRSGAAMRSGVAVRSGAAMQPGPAGLMHGAAGQALLLIRMYERTGDPAYLDAAATAITADLGQCVDDGMGGLQVNEGWRVLPYLMGGSAGIGMVISQFLPHRDDPELAAAADRIATAASAAYYAQSGLFNGRAGLLCYLAGRDGAGPSTADPRVRAHVTRLAWHAVPYQGGLAFPGDMLLRLSMDLGTGTAGVLLSLATALAPRRAAGSPLSAVVPPRLAALPCLAQPISSPSGEDEERQLARR